MVMVEAVNRRGLMGDIGQAVSQEKVDIHEARVKRRTRWAIFELLLEVTDADQLETSAGQARQNQGRTDRLPQSGLIPPRPELQHPSSAPQT